MRLPCAGPDCMQPSQAGCAGVAGGKRVASSSVSPPSAPPAAVPGPAPTPAPAAAVPVPAEAALAGKHERDEGMQGLFQQQCRWKCWHICLVTQMCCFPWLCRGNRKRRAAVSNSGGSRQRRAAAASCSSIAERRCGGCACASPTITKPAGAGGIPGRRRTERAGRVRVWRIAGPEP